MSSHSVLCGAFELSDDPQRIDCPQVHGWLAYSSWAKDIPQDRLRRGIGNSSLVAGRWRIGRSGAPSFLLAAESPENFAAHPV